jgi:hypothetical protein
MKTIPEIMDFIFAPSPSNPGKEPKLKTENSAARYELDEILEEFRVLSAQINTHMSSQQNILAFTITLLGAISAAIAAAIPAIFNQQNINIEEYIRTNEAFLLMLSLLFSSFGFMYLHEDVLLAKIEMYINQNLRIRLVKVFEEIERDCSDLFTWYTFSGNLSYRSPMIIPHAFMSFARLAISIVPALSFYGFYIYERQTGTIVQPWENLLFIFTTAFNLMFIVTMFSTTYLFIMSTRKRNLVTAQAGGERPRI